VTDRLQLYNLTRVGSGFSGNYTYTYTRQLYTSLVDYMTYNGWLPLNSYVYLMGLEVLRSREALCVSVAYDRNVLLLVPLAASSYTQVVLLAGDPNAVIDGGRIWPSRDGPVNGTASSEALLAYPSDLVYDVSTDAVYFTESFPGISGQTWFGSLTVRKYSMSGQNVSTYAGRNFCSDPYYNQIGSPGGYVDGRWYAAQFRSPQSLTVSLSSPVNGGPVLYVLDFDNSAIRVVYNAIVGPDVPSSQPTLLPSPAPSVSPTVYGKS